VKRAIGEARGVFVAFVDGVRKQTPKDSPEFAGKIIRVTR
jgi:hypothetical protein